MMLLWLSRANVNSVEIENDKDDSLMNHKTKQDKWKMKSIEIKIKDKVVVELSYIN